MEKSLGLIEILSTSKSESDDKYERILRELGALMQELKNQRLVY